MHQNLWQVNWAAMRHNFGKADDIPDLILKLNTVDLQQQKYYADKLMGFLAHQATLSEPAIFAAPILIALLDDKKFPAKAHVLEILLATLQSTAFGYETFVTKEFQAREFNAKNALKHIVASNLAVYQKLTSDPQTETRTFTLRLLDEAAPNTTEWLDKFIEYYRNESEEDLKADCLSYIGYRLARIEATNLAKSSYIEFLTEIAYQSNNETLAIQALVSLINAQNEQVPAQILRMLIAKIKTWNNRSIYLSGVMSSSILAIEDLPYPFHRIFLLELLQVVQEPMTVSRVLGSLLDSFFAEGYASDEVVLNKGELTFDQKIILWSLYHTDAYWIHQLSKYVTRFGIPKTKQALIKLLS